MNTTITEAELSSVFTPEALEHSIKSFSFSRINLFYTCAKMWAVQYVAQVKSIGSSEAVSRGEQLHEYYELLNKTPNESPEGKTVLKEFKKKYPVEALKYTKFWVPHRMTLPGGPNEFFEKEMKTWVTLSNARKTMLIGYIDYLNTNDPNNTIIIDFKSGKYTNDPHYADQAALYAYMVFVAYPKVNRVVTYLYDISDNLERSVIAENSFEFLRDRDKDNLFLSLDRIIVSIIDAVDRKAFPATPGKNCAYCPLVSCQFNKVKKEQKTKLASIQTTKSVTEKVTPIAIKTETSLDKGSPETFGFTRIGDKEKEMLLELKKSLEKTKKKEVDVVKEIEITDEPINTDEDIYR